MMGMTLEKEQEWASRSPKWAGFTVQSQFYDPGDMEKWGWVDSPANAWFYLYPPTADFLNGLHLDPGNEEKWRPVQWDHKKAWAVNGKSGPVSVIVSAFHRLTRVQAISGAQQFTFFNYDKTQPIFVVDNMFSPSYYVTTKKEPGPAPDLSKPSDLWYFQWYQHGLLHLNFPPVASKFRMCLLAYRTFDNITARQSCFKTSVNSVSFQWSIESEHTIDIEVSCLHPC